VREDGVQVTSAHRLLHTHRGEGGG
jgi:hypothetical protein